VISRGEPALMVCHWTGIYWNGRELGFEIFKEVVRRLNARFDNLIWMKLSEVARYWAAKELTRIDRSPTAVGFRAPFACPQFTIGLEGAAGADLRLESSGRSDPLREVRSAGDLQPGTWKRGRGGLTVCLDLPKGPSRLVL